MHANAQTQTNNRKQTQLTTETGQTKKRTTKKHNNYTQHEPKQQKTHKKTAKSTRK